MDNTNADSNLRNNNKKKIEGEIDNYTIDTVWVYETSSHEGYIKQEPYDVEHMLGGIHNNYINIKDENIDDLTLVAQETKLTIRCIDDKVCINQVAINNGCVRQERCGTKEEPGGISNYINIKEEFDDSTVVAQETKLTIDCINQVVISNGCVKQERCGTTKEPEGIPNYINIKEEFDDPTVTVQKTEFTCDTKENYLICCDVCGEEYDLYCVKCPTLIRIFDSDTPTLLDNRIRRTLPKNFIDIYETSSGIGIVALRAIPEGVVFGPFEGLDSTKDGAVSKWKLKHGELAYTKDPRRLNWMQYLRKADTSSHRNLIPFQYEDELYYQSDRDISVGDELLVCWDSDSDENRIRDKNSYWKPRIWESLPDTYACTFCCVGYKSISHLVAHNSRCPDKRSHKDFCKEIIQCAFCQIYLDEKEYLDYHFNRCCASNTKKYVAIPVSPDDTDKPELKDDKYKCSMCEYSTSRKDNFRKHRQKHTDLRTYKCPECHFRASTESHLQEHARLHADRTRFECEHCSERFARADFYTIHLKKEHSVSVYKCDKCSFETTNGRSLRVHLATHKDGKPYSCETCDKQFKSRAVLLGHIRNLHNEEKKKFKCPDCDFESIYQHGMKQHFLTVHTGVKRYKCSRCAFKTCYKYSLERHLHFHDDTKAMKCQWCDVEFPNRQLLVHHQREAHAFVDEIHKCSKCDYLSNRKSDLKRHLMVHDGAKPFACALCPYKTNLNAYLKRHIATHNKDKPFKCDLCPQMFKHKTSLTCHARNIHSIV